MNDTPEHDWVRGRLAAYVTGWLDETDRARFERHVSDCPECRDALESLRTPDANLGRHLPDAMIAQWERRRDRLKGLQREIVRRHLAGCDECSDTLRRLGHEPVLERVEALEPSAELLASIAPRSEGATPRPPRVERIESFWRRREFWFGGAFGGAIAAAAAALLVMGPLGRGGGEIGEPEGGVTRGVRNDSLLRLELGAGPATRTLVAREGPASASGANDTLLVPRPEERRLRLALVLDPELPPNAPVEVALITTRGEILQRMTVEGAYLLDAERGPLIRAEGDWPTADVVLRLSWEDATGAVRLAHFPIHLRP